MATENDSGSIQRLVLADEKGGAAMVAVGFLAFGFTVGAICGASEYPGISSTLLTSLFTFVAGAVLGFQGFRRSSKTRDTLSGRRIGLAMTLFSFGLLLGLATGILARWELHASRLGRSGTQNGPSEKSPVVLLHAGDGDHLRDINDALRIGAYDRAGDCKHAVSDLRWLMTRVYK